MDFYKESVKAWTAMLSPESLVQTAGAGADLFMAGQKKMRDAAVQTQETSEIPTHQDFARLAHQVELAELRAAECEARLQEAEAAHQRLEKRLAEAVRTLEEAHEN